jgi:hypothetical protein
MTQAERPTTPDHDGRPWLANPGFRVGPGELSNAAAFELVWQEADRVVAVALDARRNLLACGFAADHSVCEQLDRTAREYAALAEGSRRGWAQVRSEARAAVRAAAGSAAETRAANDCPSD